MDLTSGRLRAVGDARTVGLFHFLENSSMLITFAALRMITFAWMIVRRGEGITKGEGRGGEGRGGGVGEGEGDERGWGFDDMFPESWSDYCHCARDERSEWRGRGERGRRSSVLGRLPTGDRL